MQTALNLWRHPMKFTVNRQLCNCFWRLVTNHMIWHMRSGGKRNVSGILWETSWVTNRCSIFRPGGWVTSHVSPRKQSIGRKNAVARKWMVASRSNMVEIIMGAERAMRFLGQQVRQVATCADSKRVHHCCAATCRMRLKYIDHTPDVHYFTMGHRNCPFPCQWRNF